MGLLIVTVIVTVLLTHLMYDRYGYHLESILLVHSGPFFCHTICTFVSFVLSKHCSLKLLTCTPYGRLSCPSMLLLVLARLPVFVLSGFSLHGLFLPIQCIRWFTCFFVFVFVFVLPFLCVRWLRILAGFQAVAGPCH